MSGASKDLSNLSMMDLFRSEVDTHSASLNDGLLGLENNPRDTASLQSLMRAAHSIKGAARIVGIEAAVKIAHAMEDIFASAQEGRTLLGADDMDVLLQGVDSIVRIAGADDAAAQKWHADHADEMRQLMEAIGTIEAPHGGDRLRSSPGIALREPAAECSPPVAPSKQANESRRAHEEARPLEPSGSRPSEGTAPAVDRRPPPPVNGPISEPRQTQASAGNVDRAVRITAENLDRLMGLAGESLVDARWLQPFSNSLVQLKKEQTQLARILANCRDSLDGSLSGDELQSSVGEALQKVEACRQALADRMTEFEVFARRSSNLSNRLYREVVASRMRPFADGVQGFPRLVRDLARRLERKVDFEITGLSTGVDRDILEKLEAPLNHLLRNAVDHGIEPPEEREKAGKPVEGRIRLEARHRAGMLSITLSDDGRGIDPEQIRKRIVDKGLVSPDVAGELNDAELAEFLFLPGFSTAASVTEISGRGVGLNVVHAMVQEVGGQVRAGGTAGRGMTIHMQLPLTLSVIRTLLVEIAGEPYAFPLVRIDRSLKVSRGKVELIEDRQFFHLAGENISLISAQQVLEIDGKEAAGEELAVVILSDGTNRYGLVVDRFLGQRELVVRPLDPRLGKLPDVAAAAVMADGSPVLVLDVEDMVRSIDNLLTGGRLRKLGRHTVIAGQKRRKRILVVDDSITVREVERKILQGGGFDVEVTVNGMDGWNAVRAGAYDLVITDVDMPRMNGIELVTRIKGDPALKRMPVMIVSYKDGQEDRSRGLEAGADCYLTKSSFHDETLLRAVVDLIGETAP